MTIASILSDPINEALGDSEFLLVICTPRLSDSNWCRMEIDTFIKLYGAERVLVVLAEGEPRESFPSQLYSDQKEPLAADVRGNSKQEIRKKIKEEILRIAAAIFGCDYDDIRQHHREERLRRRIRILGGAVAVMAVFGAVTTYQALTINQQSGTSLSV